MQEHQPYPRISVVIPAYNEAENLRYVLPRIPACVDEIILVDGHSTDETVKVAQHLRPDIRFVLQPGKGKGDALCAGFAACQGDIILMLDADGSTDPGEIPRFVAALMAGYDYAKGSRFLSGGGSCDITLLRRCGNFFLSSVVNLLYQARFSDLCYGYNAFWRSCLDRVDIDCDGFEIETQISLQMLKAKCKIVEVPSFEHARIHGTSNLQIWQDGWRVLRTILRERRSRPALLAVQPPDAAAPRRDRSISVVICAFATERWDALVRAVASVQEQATSNDEIIVVVDHNTRLLQRVRDELPHVITAANDGQRGLSDARNSGIAASTGEIVAFLDDDAVAGPDWLARISAAYDDEEVLATGGTIIPIWQGKRPAWLPEEFYWVIGCTYRGQPTTAQAVRNPIGANMSFRRRVFEAAGGFRREIGRIGSRPLGCEETEMSIRAGTQLPQGTIMYQPKMIAFHQVPPSRTRWSYFLSRCYAEGLSKAAVARFVGAGKGLSAESSYALRTLPQGIARNLGEAISEGSFDALARAVAIIIGLMLTTIGYVVGRIFARRAAPQELFKPSTVRYLVDTTASLRAL